MLKVVTVLFADVVGSTARAEKMHPEDTRALMTDFFKAMSEEIEREGGTVERILGDGLMADFGIPLAHEDDPLRAVRAARAMLARLERWNADKDEMRRIELRVGINTGEVSAAGSPGQQLLVTGDAVNVAARLEQAAQPGTIVVGERTARSIRNSFELRALDPVIAKGKTEPVLAYEVLDLVAPTDAAGHLGAPLVGRDHELAALVEVFERCQRTRNPHLVTLLGEAGVGKSRLVQEFVKRLPHGPQILEGNCMSYGEGTDLWPLRELLGRISGFDNSDAPADVLAAIHRMAADHGLSEDRVHQTVAALASTVGVEPDSFRTLDLRVRHREFLLAWRALFSAMAAERPVVIVIQDIHWAGELLLDTVMDLTSRTEGPLLFLCPARPDLIDARPDWGTSATNSLTLRLGALSDVQSGELISRLIDLQDFPADQQELVLRRSEGNPFFLQELVRHLFESGHLEKSESGYRATVSISEVDIPDTVHGVLLARIDLMDDDAKRLGQQAAVVGRIFWESAVAQLCGTPRLAEMLTALERKAFITERSESSVADEIEYLFNHVLIRDALYKTMPRRSRGASHVIVADWIQDKSGDRINEHLETIAHHLERAHEFLGRNELRIKARDHLLRASKQALQRFSVKRATELANRAVALSEGPGERIEALEVAGDQAMIGYCIDDAWTAYSEAFSDARRSRGGDPSLARLAAKAAIAATRFVGAMEHTPPLEEIREKIDLGLRALEGVDQDGKARSLLLMSKAFGLPGDTSEDKAKAAGEALALAEELGDPDLISVALDASAFALSSECRFGEMYALQTRRVALVPRIKDLNEVCDIYGSASWSSFFVGRHEETIGFASECLKRAEGIGPGDYQHALQWRVMANFRAGRWDAALHDQSELEALVFEDGVVIPVFAAGAFATALLCRQLRGEDQEADRYLEMLRHLRIEQEAANEGSSALRPTTALALLHKGKIDEALDWLDYENSGFVTGLFLESRCEAARARNDLAVATSLIAELKESMAMMGVPTLKSYSDRLEGWVSQRQGGDERAENLLAGSAEGFSHLSFPWEEAMSRLLLAEHRLLRNDTQGAESELRRALFVFETLGSVREIDRTKTCLNRC